MLHLGVKKGKVVVRRLLFIVSVIIVGAVIGLLMEEDAEAGLDVEDGLPVTSFPAPFALKSVDPLTLTNHVYLPLACRNRPTGAQVPAGQYLFVEYHKHTVLGAGCESLCIDFPGYAFEPRSGELTIYTTEPPEPALVLNEGEIGYLGTLVSLTGKGCGASGVLTKVQTIPFFQDDLTLRHVDEAGVATLERQDETLVLQPGEGWVSDEEIETWDWLGAGCVVTGTYHITNHAFQDRRKIKYDSGLSAAQGSPSPVNRKGSSPLEEEGWRSITEATPR